MRGIAEHLIGVPNTYNKLIQQDKITNAMLLNSLDIKDALQSLASIFS